MTTTYDTERIATLALLALGALILLPALVMGFGMMGFGMPMIGWGAGRAPGWMVAVSAVMQIAFVLLLVGLGYLFYRTATGGGDGAMEELRRAYARGELTDEEYEQRRERLSGEE
ncbi:SHOCT domain-containing protein [Halomarina halobia]|uniref:SHOCT domain-containing protein n=1 Tax=Halomarina halobia TaxID=3033386 RepID=A0ABD6A7Z2_9EURY|nr:SHOCT domain-containing protein [Halomarina sp. PSR21]